MVAQRIPALSDYSLETNCGAGETSLTACAESAAGRTRLGGFAEVGARSVADGCDTSPVAYLEGWFVEEDLRLQGVGAALVRAAETWARAQGFREFASDVELENVESQRAHVAVGFREVERSVLYVKTLSPRKT